MSTIRITTHSKTLIKRYFRVIERCSLLDEGISIFLTDVGDEKRWWQVGDLADWQFCHRHQFRKPKSPQHLSFLNCHEYYIANIILTSTSLFHFDKVKGRADKTGLIESKHFLLADSSLSMDKLSWEMNKFFYFKWKKTWNKKLQ